MEIREVTINKRDYIDILLIGDEQESMIDKYLEKGNLLALYDDNILKSVCVTLKIDAETIEIKNFATYPQYQKRGYASVLMNFVFDKYKNDAKYLILGTGDNDEILNFYKKRGFEEYSKVKDFFITNYNHPIFENGKLLIDMIYLRKKL
jgi:ribosomal protein S18 acetylase RimI-like enzyme